MLLGRWLLVGLVPLLLVGGGAMVGVWWFQVSVLYCFCNDFLCFLFSLLQGFLWFVMVGGGGRFLGLVVVGVCGMMVVLAFVVVVLCCLYFGCLEALVSGFWRSNVPEG